MHPSDEWSVDLGHAPRLVPLPAGVRIRRFEASDAADVHALLVAVGAEAGEAGPWLARRLAQPNHDPHLMLLADTDAGELVGIAFARRGGGSASARIDVVAVAEPWRRRGAGGALLGRLLELLRRRSAVRATIEAPLTPPLAAFLVTQRFVPPATDVHA